MYRNRRPAARYSPRSYDPVARFQCPTCKREAALSAYEKARGYQCLDCTRRDEAEY